ncbi:hypothetical protein HZA55_04110 [Candidatus Poribacteria bacterium]|nr:hypothetical protein [Candidatus Poribacteria bacterium]
MIKHNIYLITIAFIIGFMSINCMNKKNNSKGDNLRENLSGNYILEYSFKVEGIQNKYFQHGTVKPWAIVHNNNEIIVENVAAGNINKSVITFSGGPLNFGAGYAVANFNGILNDSTITGTFSGNYYDPQYGASKFSSTYFVLKKINDN